MEVVYSHCAGLDVHKKTVVACVMTPDAQGKLQKDIRTFGTMTADLLTLLDWLQAHAITHVAMESTGEYWKPIYNILEGNLEVWLINAQHIKAVPGRKTDVKDAEWIADLLRHGLVRASFIPPVAQRDLRELTRHRANFVRERASLVNRVQKTLESANIKLASVATDVVGVSGRAMLEAIVAGQRDGTVLSEMAKGRMRNKRAELAQALTGRVKAHHCFVLTELLCQIDGLDETIEHFDAEVEKYCVPFQEAIPRLDTIPGVAQATAEMIVSEIGTDMSRFPSADHLAAWAGLVPGQNESAGKRRSGKMRNGNHVLRTGLVQAAHAVSHTKNNYLVAQYHRIAARRGKKKALVAVAHSILVIAYHILLRKEAYSDLGANYFDEQDPVKTAQRLVKRIEKLGYQVTMQTQPTSAAA